MAPDVTRARAIRRYFTRAEPLVIAPEPLHAAAMSRMRARLGVMAALAVLSLAGCGARSSLPEVGPGECGNGKLDPGEQCDEGPRNEDRPAVLLTQGELSRWVKPIDRKGDVFTFYQYTSKSGHTGFEEVNASQLFLYRDIDTGVMSLVSEHGIDIDSTGIEQPVSRVVQRFSGLPGGVTVGFADDGPEEFEMDSKTTAKADWNFNTNTDGAALSGLPLPGNWSIDVDTEFIEGVDRWRFLDGREIPLAMDETATLTAFDEPSPCKTDCTLPACGDGFLDAGEVCDDGNAVGGDGCAADCGSLE